MTAITGNTYPVKDQLKALGARWNPDQKAWMVTDDKVGQARQIVAGAPARGARRSDGYIGRANYAGRSNNQRGYCDDCGARLGTGTKCWETGMSH